MPNCHHYHNLNRCIAQLSRCSDSDVQQTGLAQKDLPVIVLITMTVIAMRDFHRVSSKGYEKSSIPASMIWKLMLKGDTFMHFLRDSVFDACR